MGQLRRFKSRNGRSAPTRIDTCLRTSRSNHPDKIIMLSGMFRADERTDKIDLGVGVYKDANGNTPIMRAVKKAEQLLWNEENHQKLYPLWLATARFTK